jgi:hypothetical protein
MGHLSRRFTVEGPAARSVIAGAASGRRYVMEKGESPMYCPECRCRYQGWTASCPHCGAALLDEPPSGREADGRHLSYRDLVEKVKAAGGMLSVDLLTTDVGSQRRRSFPFRGFGFAWAHRMQGTLGREHVDLRTTEVGKKRAWSFPYFGFGYAWPRRMEGEVAGNPVSLTVSRVLRERLHKFLFRGYGFAWAADFLGECGDDLAADLAITEVGRKLEWEFPYFGFGFGWERAGLFTLTLRNPS